MNHVDMNAMYMVPRLEHVIVPFDRVHTRNFLVP